MTGTLARLWLLTALLGAAFAGADGGGAGTAEWLEDGIGARWIGMGGAARAGVGDVHAGTWNPAGLEAQGPERWSVGSMFMVEGLGRSIASLSVSRRTDRGGTFGLTWARRTIAGLERVDDQGNVTERVSGTDDLLSLAWGVTPVYQCRVGVALKMLHQTLFDFSSTGMSEDLGFQLQPWLEQDVIFGLTVQNLLSIQSWNTGRSDAAARSVGGGVAWRTWRERVTVAADVVSRNGAAAPGLHVGAEVWALDQLAARAGWNDGRPAFGATYLLKPYQLDYGLSLDRQQLGLVHQVSFLLHF